LEFFIFLNKFEILLKNKVSLFLVEITNIIKMHCSGKDILDVAVISNSIDLEIFVLPDILWTQWPILKDYEFNKNLCTFHCKN
jgi:hypothetical protein